LRRNVELVVSELVTNAIKHGSGPVGLRVDTDGTRVHVAVRDADGKTLWAELYV
jgi:anti-sigma regulatory factor (Ser/Thr protein kinase)